MIYLELTRALATRTEKDTNLFCGLSIVHRSYLWDSLKPTQDLGTKCATKTLPSTFVIMCMKYSSFRIQFALAIFRLDSRKIYPRYTNSV